MTNRHYRGLAFALIGGAALASVPVFANDVPGEAAVITTATSLIGPGVSALSAPDVAFGLPVVATIPDQGWAPIGPVTGIDPSTY
jgi:hypothetical protein